MNAEPPEGPVPSVASDCAYMPFAQLAANVDWALLTARSEPMAEASLPEMRARRRPGTAIAAMMPLIATTISNSMRVKPFCFRLIIALSSRAAGRRGVAPGRQALEQPQCQMDRLRQGTLNQQVVVM